MTKQFILIVVLVAGIAVAGKAQAPARPTVDTSKITISMADFNLMIQQHNEMLQQIKDLKYQNEMLKRKISSHGAEPTAQIQGNKSTEQLRELNNLK